MSEFGGYCPKCGRREDVRAHKPCDVCGAKMVVKTMDGLTGRQLEAEGDGGIDGG